MREENNYSVFSMISIAGFTVAFIAAFLPFMTGDETGYSVFELVMDLIKTAPSVIEYTFYEKAAIGIIVVLVVLFLLSLMTALLQLLWKNQKKSGILGVVIGAVNTVAAVFLLGCVVYTVNTVTSFGGWVTEDLQKNMTAEALKIFGVGFWLFLLGNLVGFIMSVIILTQCRGNAITGYLYGMSGEYRNVSIPLKDGEKIVIGRDPKICNLVLAGSKISRKHCVIRYEAAENQYYLQDSSKNGTYMENGVRIPDMSEVGIQPGTVFYLGDRENSFRAE